MKIVSATNFYASTAANTTAAAEATIVQAKDAKHAADMQAQKIGYEQRMQDAMSAIAQREAAIIAREAEIEAEQRTQDAIRIMQDTVQEFRRELGAMADAKAREVTEAPKAGDGEPEDSGELARMQEMHAMTLNAFQQMVERLTLPRVLKRDPQTGEKMAVVEGLE